MPNRSCQKRIEQHAIEKKKYHRVEKNGHGIKSPNGTEKIGIECSRKEQNRITEKS